VITVKATHATSLFDKESIMRGRSLILIPLVLIAAGLSGVIAMADNQSQQSGYTVDFGIHSQDRLVSTGANQYLSLNPGTFRRLEGEDDGQFVEVNVTVLDKTKRIRFKAAGGMMTVKTRIIEEREWINGTLAQVSHNYFARCPESGNIYYFGERVDHYDANGDIVSHEDSWQAGKNNAKPGLAVPGFFLLGARYHQELAPHVSMDRAENVEMGLNFQTPAGLFENCVAVLETSPLEPDEEVLKVYAPGVGLIADGQLELVDYIDQ
jgi:hypothetical protein